MEELRKALANMYWKWHRGKEKHTRIDCALFCGCLCATEGLRDCALVACVAIHRRWHLVRDLEPAMRTGATTLSGMGPAKLILNDVGVRSKERGDADLQCLCNPGGDVLPTVDNFLRARAGDARHWPPR
jgi:hypothetical protein